MIFNMNYERNYFFSYENNFKQFVCKAGLPGTCFVEESNVKIKTCFLEFSLTSTFLFLTK